MAIQSPYQDPPTIREAVLTQIGIAQAQSLLVMLNEKGGCVCYDCRLETIAYMVRYLCVNEDTIPLSEALRDLCLDLGELRLECRRQAKFALECEALGALPISNDGKTN